MSENLEAECSAVQRDESRVRWGREEEMSDCEKRKEAQGTRSDVPRRHGNVGNGGEPGPRELPKPVSVESKGNGERSRIPQFPSPTTVLRFGNKPTFSL
jgi:hypothetical protein